MTDNYGLSNRIIDVKHNSFWGMFKFLLLGTCEYNLGWTMNVRQGSKDCGLQAKLSLLSVLQKENTL